MADITAAGLDAMLRIIAGAEQANLALCQSLVEAGVIERATLLKALAAKRPRIAEKYSTGSLDMLIEGLAQMAHPGLN